MDVTVVCKMCQVKMELSKLVEKSESLNTCTGAGEIFYTADVQLGDVKYPVMNAVCLPAEGHAYGEPEWIRSW